MISSEHARRFDAGAADRRLYRDLAEFVGGHRSERPVECSDGRAYRADNDDVVLHLKAPLRAHLSGDRRLSWLQQSPEVWRRSTVCVGALVFGFRRPSRNRDDA
jgi:hypothetical protein